MTIEYRLLNSVTVFNAKLGCTVEEDLHKFVRTKYFSEVDLAIAYYQIPLTEKAKPLTVSPTHKDLMEFSRLSLGLGTACATCIRLMRIVVADLLNVSFYIDSMFVYPTDWPQQVCSVRSVLVRLRKHHLTIKPGK